MSSQFIATCPQCQSKQVRTVKVFTTQWQWLNGCNVCDWEQIIGDVEE